jgi:hypothetical protein
MSGDVLGGSLVVNASSPFAPMLHQGLNNLASQVRPFKDSSTFT